MGSIQVAAKRRSFIAFILALCLGGAAVASDPIPRPAGLEDNVRFWTRIYSEIDSQAGLIHDAEHLAVVYEVIRFPSTLSQSARDRRVDGARDRIVADLRALARGRRTNLTASQQHVLAQWPKGVSNATLKRAASNVRFQRGQADRFEAGVVRAGAWRDYIEQVFSAHGLPTELSALPHVESSFTPSAYSRIGAAGLWQFTHSTGRMFMRVDQVVDERLDVYKATVAAAKLLKFNYENLGTWPLAITAYNHGTAGMAKAVRVMGTTDIATISRKYDGAAFGFASRNFYAEFLAALDVDRNAESYFGPIATDRPHKFDVVVLDHFYAPASLERAFGVDRETLRKLNPALRPAVWNGSKYVPRNFELALPRGTLKRSADEVLASIAPSERKSEQHRDRYYEVRRGDTLSGIARRYGVRERELIALNNLRSRHTIRAGQVLVLPDDAAGASVVIASSPPPADGIYRVRRGDNLSLIAKRFGSSEASLAAANGLRDRHRIYVGQSLRIPNAGSATVAAAPPAQPAAKPIAKADPPKPVAKAEPPAVTIAKAEPAPAAEATPEAAPAARPVAATKPAPRPKAEAAPAPVVVASLDETLPAPAEPEAALAVAAAEPAGGAASENAPPKPDPSDYKVDAQSRVTVQAAETLGHFAEWLEVRASRLRQLNGLKYGDGVSIGRKAKMDFSRVTPETFTRRRLAYHHTLQEEYFAAFEVTGTRTHTLKSGDTLWYLAERKYLVPVWLIRQYNPDLDFGALRVGTRMIIPEISERSS